MKEGCHLEGERGVSLHLERFLGRWGSTSWPPGPQEPCQSLRIYWPTHILKFKIFTVSWGRGQVLTSLLRVTKFKNCYVLVVLSSITSHRILKTL